VDIKGWNNTHWGMTEKDIASVFGDKIVYFDKAINWKESYAKIGLNDYSINNTLYTIRFIMSKATDTLIQVTLSRSSNNSISRGGITDYYTLQQLLVEKYGPWSYQKEDRTPDVRISRRNIIEGTTSLETAWNFSETIIEVYFTELASNIDPIQGVSYRMRKTGKGSGPL
jgi:hypothetical protein